MKRAAALYLTGLLASGGASGCGAEAGSAGGAADDAGGMGSVPGSSSGGSSSGGSSGAGGAGLDGGAGLASDAGAQSPSDATSPPSGDAANGTGGPGIVPPPGWTLLWSDEFDGTDGSDVDPTKWAHDVGDGSNTTEGTWNPGVGWGNDELEYYTPGTANTQQQGGYLVLRADKNTDPSFVCSFADKPTDANTSYHTGTCEYTSGRIKTVVGPAAGKSGPLAQNLFSHVYGRYEMRAQIPPGVGLWPAFWMMGTNLFTKSWPACGELDVMEEIGEEPGTVHGTSPMHHRLPACDGVTYASTLPGDAGLSDAFHVYAIEPGTDVAEVDSSSTTPCMEPRRRPAARRRRIGRSPTRPIRSS